MRINTQQTTELFATLSSALTALENIVAMETEHANATVRRITSTARQAINEINTVI